MSTYIVNICGKCPTEI